MLHSNIATKGPEGASAVFAVPTLARVEAALVTGLGDDALLDLQAQLAELRRRADTNLAVLAEEVARRSHHSLGHDGLAQRLGRRTAHQLVQHVTQTSAREAATLVRVGAMLGDLDRALDRALDRSLGSDPGNDPGSASANVDRAGDDGSTAAAGTSSPWLEPIASAIGDARLSVEAGDTIARALGQPDQHVTPQHLEKAAAQLVVEAAVLTLEQLGRVSHMA